MSDTLYLKYRPKTFAEVIGQNAVVKSLKNALEKRNNHTFLLHGPSGTGKTTLARIAANVLGATDRSQYREVDAATYNGIDDVRALMSALDYKPIGVKAVKVMVLDECHALSAPAWKALLKVLEEPPAWAYWFLCTTDPTRVPPTIRTRCTSYSLQPVDRDTMFEWLTGVAEKEGLLGDEEGEKVLSLCVKMSDGSPRQALVNLSACAASTTVKEARVLLRSAEGSTEVIELARALDSGATWQQVQSLLEGVKDMNPESVRQVVRAWFTKATLSAKSEKAFGHRLGVLAAFSEPFNSADGITPVVMATARALFSNR